MISNQLTAAWGEWWREVTEGFSWRTTPLAGIAVRSSNTPADLPTDASGFTAQWLSCEGEPWFASLLWYFNPWQEQNATPSSLIDMDNRHAGTTQLQDEFVNLLSQERGPYTWCFPLTSRWSRWGETPLAAADGCPQADSSLTLQTGTTRYYNNKDTLCQCEMLMFLPGVTEHQQASQRARCHCRMRFLRPRHLYY